MPSFFPDCLCVAKRLAYFQSFPALAALAFRSLFEGYYHLSSFFCECKRRKNKVVERRLWSVDFACLLNKVAVLACLHSSSSRSRYKTETCGHWAVGSIQFNHGFRYIFLGFQVILDLYVYENVGQSQYHRSLFLFEAAAPIF